MPKQTFFNLPEEKREQVFRAAVAEFAAYPYPAASINRIVTRAGIAKGSFYQYFDDKGDLFMYCLRRIGEEKLAYLAPVLQEAERIPFFDLLHELFLQGIRFAEEHPEYAAIGSRLLASKGTAIFEEAVRYSLEEGEAFFKGILEEAVQRGEVRADIDVSFTTYLLARLSNLVVEYHIERVAATYDERMMETVDRLIEILRTGIRAQEGASFPSGHHASPQGESP